ncbi:MAG: zinc metalloprotease, partial [Planctomycetes bacterium]|nr:zinc metalloprotease [Planctomycetota bacterium]
MRDSGKHSSDCPAEWSDNLYEYTIDTTFTIPVWVHVIRRLDGVTGEVSDALVQSQIDVLNEDFRAFPGTAGQNGFDTGIQFRLAGISRYNDDCAFSDTTNECMKGMQKDPNSYLNIYTKYISNALGYSYLPQTDAGEFYDGVYIDYHYFGRNAPEGYQYNQGRTGSHEVGHYLGLLHPFQDGCVSCVKPECYENSDLICDTNAQDAALYGCLTSTEEPNDSCLNCCLDNGGVVCVNGLAECADGTALSDTCQACACSVVYDPPPESCDTPDPYTNYMNFTDDTCMDRFTEEQAQRMRCSLINYRSGLAETSTSGEISTDGQTGGVYRLYNTALKVHLYSTDANEKAVLEADPDWNYEGVVWKGYTSDTGQHPVYRLYSPGLGKHLFTMDENEKNILDAGPVWHFEMIAWYANSTPDSGDIPIYRLYSDGLKQHIYTADENEKNTLNGNGVWVYEGIAYYTLPSSASTPAPASTPTPTPVSTPTPAPVSTPTPAPTPTPTPAPTPTANCTGCCSSHGGVVCVDGVPQCEDGWDGSTRFPDGDC